MRRSVIFLLLFAPLISSFVSADDTSLANPDSGGAALQLFSSLLPPALNNGALLVTLDGKVVSVNPKTMEIEWALSSGPRIHSSYRNVSYFDNCRSDDHFFVDIGEDWALYRHSNSKGKKKLASSIREYVASTPVVSEDGGVTLGSKKTTVFAVNAVTGEVIRSFRLGVDTASASLGVERTGVEGLETSGLVVLYLERTDYMLQHCTAEGNLLWKLETAEFDADFRYPKIGNGLGLENRLIANSTVPYLKKKPLVIRVPYPSSVESRSVIEGLTGGYNGGKPLPLEGPQDNLLALPFEKGRVPPHNIEGKEMLALPSLELVDSRILALPGRDVGKLDVKSSMVESVTNFPIQSLLVLFLTLLSILGYIFRSLTGKQRKLKVVSEDTKAQAVAPKKKKARRLGNNKKNNSYEKDAGNFSDGYGESNRPAHETKLLLSSSDFVDRETEGRRIGKLLVSSNEIAKGSNGTIVLEGIYDGRPVAVKRLVRTHHDVALKEIQNLIASDQHPNIVRWYGVEHDQDFVYLSLERCSCSLNDLIYYYSESIQGQIINKDEDPHYLAEYRIQLQAIMGKNKNVELWKTNGYPSPQMLKLMSDLVSGLAHLHELGIIHRDLKPQNVLIIKGRSLRAKLSDMGISKRLQGDKSSITQHATGYGSSGWQAPEQLLHQRQTRAVDLFSLGCLLFFCLTGGRHPYGDSIERDVNIVNDRKDLFLVENIPEAVDLFTHLLNPNPDMRPTAVDVLHHPFFWNSETRLSFLRDASDRVELEDRETASQLLSSLESTASVALNGKWDEKMEPAFLNNIGRYRRYKFDSIRDLLRVTRNKLNHYRELPQEIQELLGTVPEGFDSYFSSRFPKLLIEVYKVLYKYCKEEEFFRKYIKGNPV
ncbi:PREDICTED: serine/threonine-protein kinase/endoribonuclease IRE1b-like isoform X2 [Fragaria vesca subsp. vesca]|uniref:serine/threonine-protein kinase/endoribonuclease IRE1b-like isoform X2 n=1 Tax=Fragaria vesca subsp. vesca TaxID=101020 RepID=UPI0002C2DDE2|nr:PREDICTED: serine/threonine-protein kinase/endoribonuclease IRE1b-like isoform X2 [Fragaria vesca subsp. vesca]